LLRGNNLAGQNDTNGHLYNDSVSEFWWIDFISLFVMIFFIFIINNHEYLLNQNGYQTYLGEVGSSSQCFCKPRLEQIFHSK